MPSINKPQKSSIVKLYGMIEMKHFDGHYNLLLAQFETRDQILSILRNLRLLRMDERVVVSAFAYSLGLTNLENMESWERKVICYVENRYSEDWYHFQRLARLQ